MKSGELSCRRLLGGVLAAVAGWLCPRQSRVAAAPRRPKLTARLRPSERRYVVSYAYDASGRLISSAYHPAAVNEPPAPCRCTVCGQVTTYTY